MNREELKSILQSEGINPNSYSLEGGLPNEQYVLSKEGKKWSVYYSERGERTDMRTFRNEANACSYLLKLIREDPTTKR